MRPFLHPKREEITLPGVLYALSDPVRLEIFRRVQAQGAEPISCKACTPADMPRSTRTHHLRILREAGLIRSEKRGTEVLSTARSHDVEARFPGLLRAIMRAARD
ncbi:MAG TPA: helix-turn-helix domain-containing protein [Alphaproteobacteria bacterium]|nr:helix-turn-helix domain-containing protein [Alphaproteobacteria bacterium]